MNHDLDSVYDALEDMIGSADPVKRQAVVRALDGLARSYPRDYDRITGVMAPAALRDLICTVDQACRNGPRQPAKLYLIKGIPSGVGQPGAKLTQQKG
jgi:hypothetical protein